MKGYSGAANVETIGGKIIEVHLRFADQWPDLYGEGWLEAIVELYTRRRWRYPDTDRPRWIQCGLVWRSRRALPGPTEGTRR